MEKTEKNQNNSPKITKEKIDLLEWTITEIANGINIRGKVGVEAFS